MTYNIIIIITIIIYYSVYNVDYRGAAAPNKDEIPSKPCIFQATY